jgi:putative ABC transport system permease protein
MSNVEIRSGFEISETSAFFHSDFIRHLTFDIRHSDCESCRTFSMSYLLTLRIALRALAKNKLRAGLTVLGVVIGIAAVTAMVSLGQSASDLVQGQFTMLGTNVIFVFPGNVRRGPVMQSNIPTLTAKDSEAISRECPSVRASSPMVGAQGQVIFGNTNVNPREIMGVGTDFLIVRNWGLARGGFFSDRDITSAAKVCVIGQTLVGKLFQTSDPIGQTIRIKSIPVRVIGVLEEKGAALFGDDQDNIVLLPYTTVRKRLQGSEFDNAIMVSARSSEVMLDAQQEVDMLLLERHRIVPGEPRDFLVQNTTEIANVLGIITGTLTLMLSSIAAISLLVGGVGIMNIMLVSVTERTREIGIRMAVGATSRDILRQFLMEAVVLSCVGGVIGFVMGMAGSIGMTQLINSITSGTKWPVVISFPAAIVAFLFAAAVGIGFGFYPAWRASQLDPIEALRYE